MSRPRTPDFCDKWLDEEPVSDLLGVSIPALQADRSHNRTLGIPFYKFGNRVRYRLSEVVTWAEAHRIEPPGIEASDDYELRAPARRGRRRRSVAVA